MRVETLLQSRDARKRTGTNLKHFNSKNDLGNEINKNWPIGHLVFDKIFSLYKIRLVS